MPAHLLIAHAPATLMVVAAGLDLVGALAGRRPPREAATLLLVLGALTAFLAFLTGSAAVPGAVGRDISAVEAIETHSQWAGAAIWLLVGAAGLRMAWRRRLEGTFGWLNVGVVMAAAAVVVAIARSGLSIAHGA